MPSRLALTGQMVYARSKSDAVTLQMPQYIENCVCHVACGGWRTPLVIDDPDTVLRLGKPQHRLYEIPSEGAVNPRCPKHERRWIGSADRALGFKLRAAIDAPGGRSVGLDVRGRLSAIED